MKKKMSEEMNSDMKTFWIVYSWGDRNMSNEFWTKEAALEEAKLLAEHNVDNRYYVFQAVAACETEKPKVIVTELFGETEHV